MEGDVLGEIERVYAARLDAFVRTASAIVGEREAGRDAVHDAFVSAVRHREGFRAVRQAIAAGTAHVTGTARIGGKTVLRIALTARDREGNIGTVVYYVNPTTYAPVEIDYPHLVELRFPFEPIFGNGIYKETVRFSTFTVLPATPDNLKLVNIRDEHPSATLK